MANFTSVVKLAVSSLKRGLAGFAAGLVIACFILVFMGPLQSSPDLSVSEIEQQTASLWIAFYIACGTALLAAIAGNRTVSKFWLWFVLAFGIICVIPFWKHKGGAFLPFGTLYVNFGFQPRDAVILAAHITAAVLIALAIHYEWPGIKHLKLRAKKRCG